MAENPEFKIPKFSESDRDGHRGYVIHSDIPTEPFTESRLKKKLGSTTRLRGFIDSYGPRNKDKGGWYLAAGAIVVTAAGVEYFRRHHIDNSEEKS